MSTCVLQDNKKLNEKFTKITENGKSCDANISSQQNVITRAEKIKLGETSKVRSRLSDKAVQRSNPRPGTIILSSKLDHCLGSAHPTKINLTSHWVPWGSLSSHPLAALGLVKMDSI